MNKITKRFFPEKTKTTNRTQHLLKVCFILLFTVSGMKVWGQLATYNPSGLSGIATSLPATTTAANVTITAITRGSGLTSEVVSNGINSSSWNEGSTFATAISNNNFYQFTVTPAANYSLSFTNITGVGFSSGSGPATGQWGINSTAIGSSVSIGTSGTTIAASLSNTGITSSTIFQLAAWNPNNTNGTFRISNTVTLTGSAALRSAGTLVWDGGQANANWNSYTGTAANQSNWNLNNIPATGLVDALQFAGSTQTTPTNNISGLTVGSITFNSGAAAFTVGGTSITLNAGGITNSSSNLQTVSLPIALGATATINAASANITMSGAISGTGNGITKTGANTLILSGANTYSGLTTVSAGTLQFNRSGGTTFLLLMM